MMAVPAARRSRQPSRRLDRRRRRPSGRRSAILTGSINPQGQNTTLLLPVRPDPLLRRPDRRSPDAGAGNQSIRVGAPGHRPDAPHHLPLPADRGQRHRRRHGRRPHASRPPGCRSRWPILGGAEPGLCSAAARTSRGPSRAPATPAGPVELQVSAFPFIAGFVDVGNPQLTSATGGFSFPVLGLTQLTQYRVITASSPLVVSPVAVENVAVRVSVHVAAAQRSALCPPLRERHAGRARRADRDPAARPRPQRAGRAARC